MRIFVVSLLLFFVSQSTVNAQSTYFSQFYSVPLHLNPALTGQFKGDHRLQIIYRNQWTSSLGDNSYRTTAISYDTEVDLHKGGSIGLGYQGMLDKAGIATSYYNNALASYSYRTSEREAASFQEISLGVKFTNSYRDLSLDEAMWPSEHDGSGGLDRR